VGADGGAGHHRLSAYLPGIGPPAGRPGHNGGMEGHLLSVDGATGAVDGRAVSTGDAMTASVEGLLADGSDFWLDLDGFDDADAPALLGGTLGLHALAIEDAEHFGQRPKLDTYETASVLVAYGATAGGRLVEVHCFFAEHFLVTLHHDPCPELGALAARLERRDAPLPGPAMLLHHVLDALVDGFFPTLASLDDEIDALEDEILRRPTEAQLGRLFDLKRSLIAMRKVVTPERDLLASLTSAPELVPGMTSEAERYFRDLYDHLIRVSDLVDSYRDLLSGAMDTHLSTVSNRLNVVMKQLTMIATVFLPLSFLTGFFGQNFGWMVARLSGLPVFAGAGIGLQVVVVVGLVVLFRRRGWLSADGTASSPATRPARPASDRWHQLVTSGHTGPRR
jgi:magnesium transporter